jgi:hypothetical protein
MMRSFKNSVPILVVFLIINLACNFPTGNSTTSVLENTPVPPPQLAGEGESSFNHDSATGRVTIVLTEYDLTSILISEMEAQENPPLHNPQVLLRDDQIEVLGQAQTGPFRSDVRLVMVVNIDPDGNPIFQVVSADVGSVPAPAQVRDQLTDIANDTFRRSIGPKMQGYRAESVVVDAGRITITGVPQ